MSGEQLDAPFAASCRLPACMRQMWEGAATIHCPWLPILRVSTASIVPPGVRRPQLQVRPCRWPMAVLWVLYVRMASMCGFWVDVHSRFVEPTPPGKGSSHTRRRSMGRCWDSAIYGVLSPNLVRSSSLPATDAPKARWAASTFWRL